MTVAAIRVNEFEPTENKYDNKKDNSYEEL
jgi:hypothetical protein